MSLAFPRLGSWGLVELFLWLACSAAAAAAVEEAAMATALAPLLVEHHPPQHLLSQLRVHADL
jgi:hypothetical protein